MLRNKFISAALCAALAFSLAGCMEQAASDVSDTASRIESGAGEAVSRVESGMEEAGSRVASAVESAWTRTRAESKAPAPRPAEALGNQTSRPSPYASGAGGLFLPACAPGAFLLYWDKNFSRRAFHDSLLCF